MFRTIESLTIAICMLSVVGCGGGGSNGNQGKTLVQVQIQQTRFFPKFVTIAPGGQIQWVTVAPGLHQVVSGTLDPQGNPLTIHNIDITLTGFNPQNSTADLGDTIQFNNLTGRQFTMDIVDDNGKVVSTVSFAIGELRTVVFPGAGLFTFRETGSQVFQGTLTLFGQPNPSGFFQSPVMANGESFTVQLNNVGNFPYFDLDQNNPNRSFKTGVITVQ